MHIEYGYMSITKTIEKLEGYLIEIDSLLLSVKVYEEETARYERFLKYISGWGENILEGGRMIRIGPQEFMEEGVHNVYDVLAAISCLEDPTCTESHTH